jgi:hypothetical protein
LSAQPSRTPQVDKNGQLGKCGKTAQTGCDKPDATNQWEKNSRDNRRSRNPKPTQAMGFKFNLLPRNP